MIYDVLVIGAGLSGMAMGYYQKQTKLSNKRCNSLCAIFPIFLWLRKFTFKPVKWVIPGASVAILAFGLVWFIERAF